MTKKEMEKKIEELEKEVKFLKQNLMILPEITEAEIHSMRTETTNLKDKPVPPKNAFKKRRTKERFILDYLLYNMGDFISVDDLSRAMGKEFGFDDWNASHALPTCKKLTKEGRIIDNKKGFYKLKIGD